jgi:hypothetical protein
MSCVNRNDFLDQYCSAVRAYHEAVQRLRAAPKDGFDQAWQQIEKARAQTGAARAALLSHEHEHACHTDKIGEGAVPPQESDGFILGDQGQSGG